MRATFVRMALLILVSIAGYTIAASTEHPPAASPHLSAASTAIPRTAPSPGRGDLYRVVKVIDGDTLIIDLEGTDTTLRLIGLDTPETVDPRKPVQCFGAKASARARELLEGARVTIEYDESQGRLDKYGRTLAYVFLEDGTFFSESMIAEGYGHEYTYASPYKYQSDFKAAEDAAREQKKGLWAEGACANTGSSPHPAVAIPSGEFECSRNAYNCTDFSSRIEAQSVFDACGTSDVHKLDSDGDGEACESLP